MKQAGSGRIAFWGGANHSKYSISGDIVDKSSITRKRIGWFSSCKQAETVCYNIDSDRVGGTDIRTCGYPFESAHILVYPVHFADKRLDWPDIEGDLRKVKEYYRKQSYGRFNVTWEIKPETYISERTADIDWTRWGELNKEIVSNSGVSYPQPGGNKLILFIRPFLGPGLGWNSTGGGKVMRIFDGHKGPGVIAHEMGHAMGLRHANSIETGKRSNQNAIEIDSGTVIDNRDPWAMGCAGWKGCNDYLVEYGSPDTMMGGGAHGLEEYNLIYKSFYKNWIDKSNDVPLITRSGTYRIYSFDHAVKGQGYIGLRLKSGNGKYTYWLEYRTRGRNFEDNSKSGVLVNVEGYFEKEKDPEFWKTTTYMLDMTPGSVSSGLDTRDAALMTGKTYRDYWGKFRITPLQKGGQSNSGYAWIEVKVEILK